MSMNDASVAPPAQPDPSSLVGGLLRALGLTLVVAILWAVGLVLATSLFGMNDAIAMMSVAWLFPASLIAITLRTVSSLRKRGRQREARAFAITIGCLSAVLILAAMLFGLLLTAIGDGMKGAAG